MEETDWMKHSGMSLFNPQKMKKALLVGPYQGGSRNLPICEEHLQELALLGRTLGIEEEILFPCHLRKIESATYLTKGKVEEVAQMAKENEVNLVVFDEEILPSQQKNLEKIFGVMVMDRTEIILEVFHQHARSREARLQVELAQVQYQFPRLKRLWTHLSRQKGGSVFSKGEGEKQVELDRRMLNKRIHRLQKEISEVESHRKTQRKSREKQEVPTFAIIGYTNVGKSTLLNALTEADVLVEDKLFATLDTTTRKFVLPNNQEILLTDTVGFIRKLPHQLIAAFRGTLEEAVEADILIHLIDVSHPAALEQAEASFDVLKEFKADSQPIINVLNKVDQIENRPALLKWKAKFPHTVELSAKTGEGFELLQNLMVEELQKRRQIVNMRIPQKDYHVVSQLMKLGNVLQQDYEENDVHIRVDAPIAVIKKWEKYIT